MELVDQIITLASDLGLDIPKSTPEYGTLSSIASQVGYSDYSYTPSGNRELYERLSKIHSQRSNNDFDFDDEEFVSGDSNDEDNLLKDDDDKSSENLIEESSTDKSDGKIIEKENLPVNQESSNRYSNSSSNESPKGNYKINQYKKPKNNAVAESAKKEGADAAKKAASTKTAEEAAKTAQKTAAKKAAKTAAKKETATILEAGLKALLKNPYFWIVVGIFAFMFILIIVFLIFLYADSYSKFGTGEFPYVKMDFSETVVLTTNGESESMPLDDYVACVLNGEVGETTLSDEHLKAFAIAIRSNVLNKGGEVGSGTGFQVAKCEAGVTDEGSHLHKIAEETTGIVLIDGGTDNPQFHYSMYDELAFNESCGGSEKDGIITICQQGVQVSREWLNAHGKTDARIDYLKDNAYHGQGMSQMGAYYLALEEGYDYKQLLGLFYSDATIISLYPPKVVDIDLDIIETDTDWPELDEAIADLLSSHGSSITIANDALRDAVISAGPGTRQAVATAAIYINNLVAQYEVQLPYFYAGGWGDWYSNDKNVNYYYGINPYWGNYAYNGTNPENYQHLGLDCASFVSWALHNGGLTYPSGDIPNYKWLDEVDYYSVFDTSSYIGQPGDILVHPGHVRLIVGYYEEGNDKGYYVAEASGYANDVFIAKRSIDSFGDSEEVGDMSYFYKNNVISDYKSAFEEGRLD